jgi:hypothetical protein
VYLGTTTALLLASSSGWKQTEKNTFPILALHFSQEKMGNES